MAAAKAWSPEHQRLVGEVIYGNHYNDLCARFYGNMDLLINVLQVVAGSSVLAGAAAVLLPDGKGAISPFWSAIGGVALTALSALAAFWHPAVRAERHRQCAGSFVALRTRAWSAPTKQLAAEVGALQQGGPVGPRGLEASAWNRAVASYGGKPEPLGSWSRFLDLLA